MAACHGTLDVAVHLHSFRNVDLFSRGIYMIRVSTSAKVSKHVGIPYSYYSKPSTHSTFVRQQEIPAAHAKTLPVAQIVNETSEFSSRAFVIKYRDERLELNEGVQFQLLVESKVVTDADGTQRLSFEDDEPMTVKLELLMAELEKPSVAEEMARNNTPGSTVAAEKPSSEPTFTRIASQTLSIVCDPASLQLHAYFPATFSAMHFCQLECTVHTALINLKFRKRAYSRAEAVASSALSSLQTARQEHPASFEQLLFGTKKMVTPAEARAVSRTYLQPMLQSLGATAAALRNMVGQDDEVLAPEDSGEDGSSVASVVALLTDQTDMSRQVDESLATPAGVAESIEKDIKLVARRLFLLWGRFVALLPHETHKKRNNSREKPQTTVVARLERHWLAAQKKWWASRHYSEHVRVQKILKPNDPALLDEAFGALRKAQDSQETPKRFLNVYDETMLKNPAMLPVCASHVFLRRDEQSAQPLASAQQPGIPDFDEEEYKGPHLIVMQHGWYASSFDMRLLRAYALLIFPRAVVLSPQSNEDNSGGSMGPMGQRLAHEVNNFIKHRCEELCDPDPKIGRISFFGHSAGSMIVRTALTTPVFRQYLPKLHAFVSLSSSHCGNMFVPSSIIAGGMWALQHLHQSRFMDELQLIDHPDMREAFMYKLSQEKGFEHFRYVVLVASQQDAYVPLHTAQATIPRPAEKDASDGSAYMQMATNLMAPISQKTSASPKQTTVVRLTMDYKFPQTNLDTVIGRAAHLAYIDSPSAVLLILFSLYNLLK